MIYKKIMTTALALLLLGFAAIGNTTTNQAFACGLDNIQDCFSAVGASSGGYYAGQQDAIYDHDHNLVYNPQPQQVNIYHPAGYDEQFRQGYDNQWNSYQSQSSSVYINNSPGARVNVDQSAGSNEGPQQQQSEPIGCGFVKQCVNPCSGNGPCGVGPGPCSGDFGCGYHHFWQGCGFSGCGSYGYRHVFAEDP